MKSSRRERAITGRTSARSSSVVEGSSSQGHQNPSARSRKAHSARSATIAQRALAEAKIRTLDEDAFKNNAMELKEWRSAYRPPPTPLPVPARIGSIGSGGTSGFGYHYASIGVAPERYPEPAGYPALLPLEGGERAPAVTPGPVPWWQRRRYESGRGGSAFIKGTVNTELRKLGGPLPTPVPRGAALNVAVLQKDGIGTELEEFCMTRPDLEGADESVKQRELLATVLKRMDGKEVSRHDLLGPSYFGLSREEALGRLMDAVNGEYGGNFSQLYRHLQDSAFLTKVGSSTQMRRTINPPTEYAPPPHHPDSMDGYQTGRRKHEAAMNRLYGPSSGRVHVLPDGPSNWNRRDGLRCGIADIQSFTNYMHLLQNAGFGAP